MSILTTAVTHYRSTFCIMFLIVVAGLYSYNAMPVSAQPEVDVPYVYIGVTLDGVSPEDGARLLARPLEQELEALEGLDEIIATSRESHATLLVKFEAGAVDIDKAMQDVRNAVDRAKAELPQDADEPIVEEITVSDFPTITVALTADPGTKERLVYQTAKMLQREIESLTDVLEANLAGHREEVVEALINPARLEHYNITSDELISAVVGNNLLVPAGQIDTGQGKFSVKVPGLIETYQDVYAIPIKSTSEGVVTLGDVTDIRRTFKDAESFTTVDNQPAILLEVNKRTGGNQIQVSEHVRQLVEHLSEQTPPGVHVSFALDQSEFSAGMVAEMSGNIITSMVLVLVIVVAALGFRSGSLVGMGIPFSLLLSLIGLHYLDFAFNMMVMFGMMLALGMLIDGSIVITEFADRKMAEGMSSQAAYKISVRRMFWPVVASTATTLAAFLPIMFWPGIAGDFMRYLPVTVFCVLVASLFYALLFAPVIGSLMGKSEIAPDVQAYLRSLETDPPTELPGHTGRYARLLETVLRRPVVFFLGTLVVLVAIFLAYGRFSNGVVFFTDTEEKYGIVAVRAMGNLSVEEARLLVRDVESRVLAVHGVHSTYSSSDSGGGGRESSKDEIGTVLVELKDPDKIGYSTRLVFENIRKATADMPGIIVSADAFEGGPPVGRPIQIQLESLDSDKLLAETLKVRHHLEYGMEELRDITDTTPLPGIEWEMSVNRSLAAQAGVNVVEIGRAVQLVTSGVLIGEYRPDDADEEVEIRIRYPSDVRGINALDNLRVNTPKGPVPITGFVERIAKPKVDKVERIDAIQVMKVRADVEEGILADDKVAEIKQWLEANPLDRDVRVVFRGANEEQEKSMNFLAVAFSLALFLMFVLLVTQFNSFYQGLLILSAVIMSTAGVLLGLLLTGGVFSTILTGVGIVALAGIVVNNNIVLIDTYNYVRKDNKEFTVKQAIIVACAQRLRPVFLTTATTILGLFPIAAAVSVDLLGRNVVVDGVITSQFQPLAFAIVSGLLFSTALTLLVTPVMLIMPSRLLYLYRLLVLPKIEPLLTRLKRAPSKQA
ncbi:efflux RND transporter permease subunit [Aestuariicella hydrocarbonica]|uniref:Efflux RND transporter permease subunit n=1 Tax=Pseudomaricurvus hydrocarbonicus TaxID=1470433 RepID=A0A9E5MLZ2_9GAMM|nr:efflux RND transporter permease subunit [Aestuariicella hydrocarbonica]NHO65045.1 efflux RND transporter permease subunit [Aestuariicella hydrocarbonica]